MRTSKQYCDKVFDVISKIRTKKLHLTKNLRDNYGLPAHIRKARVDSSHQMTIEFKDYIATGGWDEHRKSVFEVKTEGELEIVLYIDKLCNEYGIKKGNLLAILGN